MASMIRQLHNLTKVTKAKMSFRVFRVDYQHTRSVNLHMVGHTHSKQLTLVTSLEVSTSIKL